eukprot:8119617-Pyramimonas_sp.AAC.1
MAAPPNFDTPLHTLRGPRGSSTEGLSGAIRMAAPPHRAPPKVAVAQLSWRRRPILAHPSHASRPRRGVPPKAPVAQFA